MAHASRARRCRLVAQRGRARPARPHARLQGPVAVQPPRAHAVRLAARPAERPRSRQCAWPRQESKAALSSRGERTHQAANLATTAPGRQARPGAWGSGGDHPPRGPGCLLRGQPMQAGGREHQEPGPPARAHDGWARRWAPRAEPGRPCPSPGAQGRAPIGLQRRGGMHILDCAGGAAVRRAGRSGAGHDRVCALDGPPNWASPRPCVTASRRRSQRAPRPQAPWIEGPPAPRTRQRWRPARRAAAVPPTSRPAPRRGPLGLPAQRQAGE